MLVSCTIGDPASSSAELTLDVAAPYEAAVAFGGVLLSMNDEVSTATQSTTILHRTAHTMRLVEKNVAHAVVGACVS